MDEVKVQLTGVRAVADRHLAALDELSRMTADLVGETLDEYGYGDSSDFVYGQFTVDQFIARHKGQADGE